MQWPVMVHLVELLELWLLQKKESSVKCSQETDFPDSQNIKLNCSNRFCVCALNCRAYPYQKLRHFHCLCLDSARKSRDYQELLQSFLTQCEDREDSRPSLTRAERRLERTRVNWCAPCPAMFYEQMVVGKKGSLGLVWLAAHCEKKLLKSQINDCKIVKTVGLFRLQITI